MELRTGPGAARLSHNQFALLFFFLFAVQICIEKPEASTLDAFTSAYGPGVMHRIYPLSLAFDYARRIL